ncbi:hypothetical protein Q8F55_002220 [Vanrija albida]|uniref:Major facilitator superfamily (MFS) profile domain-containing protein n=1 Tax=Vanrija albida TaxID=181172 RepID=A0ABR3Q965_9TREE
MSTTAESKPALTAAESKPASTAAESKPASTADDAKSRPSHDAAPELAYADHTYHTPAKWSWAAVKHWITDRDVHVWWMSFGFTLLFTSYPIQGVQTIRFPTTGSYILIVLYSAYLVTSMWATYFLSWWGLEWCLPWGPISYATWIACMFSGNTAANLLIAAVSTPHNRATNAGIYQCAFHVGVWAGGLILGAVQKTFSNYNHQYAVFVSLAGTAAVCMILHAFSFRRRFRSKKAAAAAEDPARVARVQLDDGTVEYRAFDARDLRSESAVVQDLALSGGRSGKVRLDREYWRTNFWNPVKMLWNPVFGPLGPAIFVTGGITQGWFNASFNKIVYQVGGEWNGWIYAISESWAIVASIVFGLFYDRLRSNYVAARYRWVMYVYVVAYYILCGLALAAHYLGERGIGHGPGQTSPAAFKAVLSFTGAFYNIQLLALEVSILTYLSTFLTYNADVAFSSKIACEAGGYLLVFGLVNVLSPKWMIVLLFCVGPPAHAVYLLGWHAPERPVAEIVGEAGVPEAREEPTEAAAPTEK